MPPIDCPCCLGKPGFKFDTDEGIYTDEPCTACKGSGILPEQDNRTKGYKKYEYTATEKAIMKMALTARQALKELITAGYTNRSYGSIKKWRTRNGIKRVHR